ncbi:hypothetical protein XENOCAPTIV_010909 [Xenoophorus captivus]|uniref:Uncharacterized protein n=1 Tax=Xenoophorus captivus TaxID=1517983 RepID=A0ABV0QHL0_9TELE
MSKSFKAITGYIAVIKRNTTKKKSRQCAVLIEMWLHFGGGAGEPACLVRRGVPCRRVGVQHPWARPGFGCGVGGVPSPWCAVVTFFQCFLLWILIFLTHKQPY